MPSTNFHRSARIREATRGVTPANPALAYQYVLQNTLKPTDPFGRSETISGSRAIEEHLRLGRACAGNIAVELALGWSDVLIENALFDDFAPLVEAYNATADSSITNIDSATQTMLAAGAWAPGMIVKTSGNAVAGNNKVFKAQAGTGAGTIVAPAATFTASEAAPIAGARALAVGVEGAAGDFVAAADGITSTAFDFTTAAIQPGVAVKIAGFDNAALDILAYVVGVSANKLTLGGLGAAWAGGVGAGAGKTVKVYIGDYAENGDSVFTDSIFNWNSKTSPIAYEAFTGVAVNTLQIPLTLNQIIRPTAGLVGFQGAVSEALPAGATLADPIVGVSRQPIKTGDNIGRLIEGDATLGSPACCQQMTIGVNNNLTPANCLTSDAAVDWNEGDFEVTVDAQWRYRDKTLLEKFHIGQASSNLVWAKRGEIGYVFHVKNGVYTDVGAPVPGRNQEHVVATKLEAQKNANGKVFGATRFRYFT